MSETSDSGLLGNGSVSAQLTWQVDFNVSGTLGTELRLGTNAVSADRLDVTDLQGRPVTAENVGIKGLQVAVSVPLSTDRTVALSVEEGEIASTLDPPAASVRPQFISGLLLAAATRCLDMSRRSAWHTIRGNPCLIGVFLVGLSGCWTAGVGASIDSNAQPLVSLEATTGLDAGGVKTGVVSRIRGNAQYFGVSFGAEGCLRGRGLNAPKYCARVYPIEFAKDQGQTRNSYASPAVGIGWWQLAKHPDELQRGSLGYTTGHGLEATLWLGANIRPTEQFQHSSIYLNLTLGGGYGASFY